MTASRACERCLARPWLLARLGGHLDVVRGRISAVLELCDADLIAAVAGDQRASVRRELERFDAGAARRRAGTFGLELICRCDPGYPHRLAELPRPPAVLHVAGGLDRFLRLAAEPPVAIVGARRASDYGLEVASSLGRDLGAAVVTVVSGMALGIDSAAHGGALAASAPTLAVLPAGADRPYPRSRHALWRRIQAAGAVVSELPPETPVRRWMFPARNRIIAALAAMTVVVQASEHSGALTTAASARELGRSVGAVPGRVNSRLAYGTNKLIADGAVLVRGAQDVLDQVFGAGLRPVPARRTRTDLSPDAVAVLDALGDGADTPAALAHAGFSVERALRLLAWLELDGLVKRGASGRFTPVA